MASLQDHVLRWQRIQRAPSKLLMMMGKFKDTPNTVSCLIMQLMLTNLIYFQHRCPVDQSIFPGFTPDANALQSIYEAFRFTESYGVIFQCNVKYCLGPCEPAVCEWGRDSMESWGRKRRSVGNETSSDDDMNISQEILVLDFGDENNKDFLRSPDPSTEFGRGEIFFEFTLAN